MLQEKTHKTWAEMMKEDAEKEGMAKGMEKGLEKGLERGMERGMEKGHAQMLAAQLQAKFGTLDDPVRSRLEGADTEQLLRWGTRLLTAQRMEDVFE